MPISDTISPKLFTACSDVFRESERDDMRIKSIGESGNVYFKLRVAPVLNLVSLTVYLPRESPSTHLSTRSKEIKNNRMN